MSLRSMTNDLQEREFYEKFQFYQQLRMEADTRVKQRDLVASSINEISLTISALEEIKKLDEGKEMLIPLGSGAFIAASLKDNKKMLLDLSAESFSKKTIAEGLASLKSRNEELQKAMESLNNELGGMEKQINDLAYEIEKLSANMQKG